jgi:hypothetical protein
MMIVPINTEGLNMPASRIWDESEILSNPKEKIKDLLLMHIRNVWTEDGLYFLGIEKRFGTAAAIEIDREVWAVMGKLEARRIKKAMNIKDNDINSLLTALRYTTWLLDLENKEYELEKNRLIIRNTNCRVQKTRIEKGLGEFNCKPVRSGFLSSFVGEFNPKIKLKCNVCPPDEHPEYLFCEWEFILE